MSDNLPTPKPPLRAGGNVMSIVPQTFEDTMRIGRAVVMAGLAPAALVGTKQGDEAASAVAIAIMSGAELGLQPMVSLRSFTVINGKPALYGDGLINVVRQSGRVAYLRTGCDERNGQLVGWCEAKRNDTEEDKRVEFSQADAVRAGLWSDTAKVKKYKSDGTSYEKANDSPWFRYPQRMLAWRAAGYCLRELFGDVLGGIRDEFEAREIAEVEEMRDITPSRQPFEYPNPDAPEPPTDAKTVSGQVDTTATDLPSHGEDGGEADYEDALLALEADIAAAKTAEDVEATFDAADVPHVFPDDDLRSRAFAIKRAKLAALVAIDNAKGG